MRPPDTLNRADFQGENSFRRLPGKQAQALGEKIFSKGLTAANTAV